MGVMTETSPCASASIIATNPIVWMAPIPGAVLRTAVETRKPRSMTTAASDEIAANVTIWYVRMVPVEAPRVSASLNRNSAMPMDAVAAINTASILPGIAIAVLAAPPSNSQIAITAQRKPAALIADMVSPRSHNASSAAITNCSLNTGAATLTAPVRKLTVNR